MSKRTRRRQRKSTTSSIAARTRSLSRRTSVRDAIPTDYTYIIRDLKRIALFGGLLIAGLIVLSFYIQ